MLGLFFGGDALVRGAVQIAQRLGISPLVIGLTLVGFGTSTPELVTSLDAVRIGADGIAIGNVVGSNTANILLILGIAALISPIAVSSLAFRRDGTVLAVASELCVALVVMGTLGRGGGAVLVALLVAYLVGTILYERRAASPAAGVYEAEAASELEDAGDTPLGRSLLILLAGFAGVLVGAKALVWAAVELASQFGVSDAVIGVTVVAIGTSLPELVTSAMAARKGEADIAFGNVVGSNIFNILGILGITALVSPLEIPASIASLDIWVMAAATLALFWVAITGWRITRGEGALLLALYGGYLWLTLANA